MIPFDAKLFGGDQQRTDDRRGRRHQQEPEILADIGRIIMGRAEVKNEESLPPSRSGGAVHQRKAASC